MFNGQHHWMMDGFEWMWGMHWAGGIIWALLFIGVVIWLFRNGTSDASGSGQLSPMELLQRSYAEGKMSTEEYEQRKMTLHSEM